MWCRCSFLNLYVAEEGECISLDEAASRLGVERRRIYDIVNVLESIEVRCSHFANCSIIRDCPILLEVHESGHDVRFTFLRWCSSELANGRGIIS